MVKCPLCGAGAADGTAECASCGAIFAKIAERRERERRAAQEGLALAAAGATSSAPDIWKLRAAAVGAVVVWMLGFGLYYRARVRRLAAEKKPRVFSPDSTAVVRDASGKVYTLKVHVPAPRAAAARPSPAARAEPKPLEPPAGLPAPDPDFDD